MIETLAKMFGYCHRAVRLEDGDQDTERLIEGLNVEWARCRTRSAPERRESSGTERSGILAGT